MLKKTEIVEAAAFTELEEQDGLVGSRYKVRLIEGDRLGSTGYYPAATLLRDGPKIFKKGTPMYLNHLTAAERAVRPNGNIEQYAGELAEDAYYENDGLYADIEVFEHHRPMIKSLKDKIGISIRARGMTVLETINGQSVPVFKELNLARSADFVVKAGAGGKIVETLEESLENSETDSEAQEGSQNMDEVLQELKAMRTEFGTRFTAIEEAAKPVEATEEESADEVYAKALEIAEAFNGSTLDADGRTRVLDLHRANKKPIAELIEAEESYVKKSAAQSTVTEGTEEEIEAEEAAKADKVTKITLPSVWNKGNK